MSFAISNILINKECCKKLNPKIENDGKINTSFKIMLAYLIVDAFVAVTSLVIGILGMLGILALPPIASYALLGLSAAIIASWVVMAIVTKGDGFKLAKFLITGLVCSGSNKQQLNGNQQTV